MVIRVISDNRVDFKSERFIRDSSWMAEGGIIVSDGIVDDAI